MGWDEVSVCWAGARCHDGVTALKRPAGSAPRLRDRFAAMSVKDCKEADAGPARELQLDGVCVLEA